MKIREWLWFIDNLKPTLEEHHFYWGTSDHPWPPSDSSLSFLQQNMFGPQYILQPFASSTRHYSEGCTPWGVEDEGTVEELRQNCVGVGDPDFDLNKLLFGGDEYYEQGGFIEDTPGMKNVHHLSEEEPEGYV